MYALPGMTLLTLCHPLFPSTLQFAMESRSQRGAKAAQSANPSVHKHTDVKVELQETNPLGSVPKA